MSLKDRAAEMAARGGSAETESPAQPLGPPTPTHYSDPLPDVDIAEPGPDGPEQVPVHVAWSRVMGTVRSVAKEQEVKEGRRFYYRGIDDALNVFGPACRLHGVLVLPVQVQPSHRDATTSKGNPTRECMVVVTYRIIGPAGDWLEVQAAGEALDSSDKGTAQAQSVALRTLLFHGGLVPTGDPDADSKVIERGEAPVRPAASYRDEALDLGTSKQRMQQIHYELRQHGRLGEVVQNETGDEEQIGALIVRIGKERGFAGGAS